MYVEGNGRIFVNVHSDAYHFLSDFLISCCEPVSRTAHINEYRLDASSLSAASAEGTYTTAIIRNILVYFRLDESGNMPITMQRFEELRQRCMSDRDRGVRGRGAAIKRRRELVGGESETDGNSGSKNHTNTVDNGIAAAGDQSTNTSSLTAPRQAGDGSSVPVRTLRLSFKSSSTAPLPSDSTGSVRHEDSEKGGAATLPDAKPATPTTRLRLFAKSADAVSHAPEGAPRQTSLEQPSASTNDTHSEISNNGGQPGGIASEERGHTVLTSLPMVHEAVEVPTAVRPLPPLIEKLLQEEERSSRVRIVLQPAQEFLPSVQVGSQSPLLQRQSSHVGLRYFITTSDRAHLEYIVAHLKEYLQPTMLRGVERWVISDVDRGVEEAALVETSRGMILHRLFFPRPVEEQRQTARGTKTSGSLDRSHVQKKTSRLIYKALIIPGKLRNARERLFKMLGVRADCFYDYRSDPSLNVRGLSLGERVRLRPYQVAALERFRQGQKAHQGVVVLPCGAGKTLTGIAAACTVGKRVMALCINVMSVLQWRAEFLRWTNLSEDQVTVCIGGTKQIPGEVFITTYNMLVTKRPAADATSAATMTEDAKLTAKIMDVIQTEAWGLLVLDEVHTALAHHFQEVMNKVQFHCALGLSATLLREDERIDDLRHLVGPKLYEANWLELTRSGFLANVECAEVQCTLPPSFFASYMSAMRGESSEHVEYGRSSRRGAGGIPAFARAVTCINPSKLWCAQALLEFHKNRSPPDKVIVFCDYLEGVRYYARYLGIPLMDGKTSEEERNNLLQYFQFSSHVNAIMLSRVGDTALDLPNASVIIQITGLGASRRQEAQRLGRILRPKPPSIDNTCSYFYTLVTKDTHEVKESYARQSWLRDQGFAYRVLSSETVLKEFSRLNGVRCCIGPPQWWYEANREEGRAFTSALQRSDQSAVEDMSEDQLGVAISLSGQTPLQKEYNNGKGRGLGAGATTASGAMLRFEKSACDAVVSQFFKPPDEKRMRSSRDHVWIPLSLANSRRIQHHFWRGDEKAVVQDESTDPALAMLKRTNRLRDLHLMGTLRTHDDPATWEVEFNSANAPETYGVLHMESREQGVEESWEGDERGANESATGTRRICVGTPRTHDCSSNGTCLMFALDQVAYYLKRSQIKQN